MKKRKVLLSMLILGVVTVSAIVFTEDIKNVLAANFIKLNSKSVNLELGHYQTLKISGTSKKATWTSSNPKVATVNSKGRVTAKAAGSTTITAHVDGRKLRANVSVFQIYKKNVVLGENGTQSITIWGPVKDVKWSSSNEAVATVAGKSVNSNNGTAKGLITAQGKGKATIRAEVNGKKILESNVTVATINPQSVVLEIGDWYGHLKTLNVEGVTGNITWATSNKSVAIVSKNGRVEAKGPGTATITANVNGSKLTTEVKVLQLSTKNFTLKEGESKKLSVAGTNSDIVWHSNQKSVVTVTDNGTVKAVGKGSAIIMVTVDGRTMNSRVTVK
ncbi:MAG TPA: hypothetical protein GXZ21_08135 [Clostridiales bacterium]|nr:hypothetical protein [Clostridiales bacterium]